MESPRGKVRFAIRYCEVNVVYKNGLPERVVLVTGVSSGIGCAIARSLALKGWRVYGTARHPDPAKALPGVELLPLDVHDDASVAACFETLIAGAGHLDAVVNNAGATLVGAVEETSVDEARALFETNFFGVHRVTRAALERMRPHRRGRIVVIGSIAGFLPKPFEAFYSASKHAVEAYVESLDFEVRPFGLNVLLIEPGFVRTKLAAHSTRTAQALNAYETMRTGIEAILKRDIASGADPERVAFVVSEALETDRPRLRYRVGDDAEQLYWLRRLLPEGWFAAGMRRKFGIVGNPLD
jgi:NAD(P)-dependent dehydrogenase (short-subunit alcohol dehydrogenase family)